MNTEGRAVPTQSTHDERASVAVAVGAHHWLLQHLQVSYQSGSALPKEDLEVRSSLWLKLVLERALLLPTVLLVGRPVLLLALGATVPGHLATPTNVELPELLLDHRAGRVMALIVGTGSLLLLYHVPIGVVVPGHIQDRELLFYGVRGKLLNRQPV